MDQVRVIPFEVARLRFDLAEAYGAEAVNGLEDAGPPVITVQTFLLDLPGRAVLVDAPHYDPDDTPETYLLPDYVAPPPLEAQLRSRGIAAGDVDDVILTHLHFDHYGALTRRTQDGWEPTFANARHLLGRGDWPPDPDEAGALLDRTVGVIERRGQLTLTDADGDAGPDIDLGGGLSLLPAPGESPGHQLVRAQVGDDVVYIVGDLFHHSVEFRGAGMDVRWADADKMAASKRALTRRAAEEGARVYASHIGGAYRAARACGGFRWLRLDA